MEEMRKYKEKKQAKEAAPGAFRSLRPLVLASASPRRRELLGLLGIAFEILTADGAEPLPAEESPTAYAIRAATAKARAVAEKFAQGADKNEELPVIIGADTIVVLPEAHEPGAAQLKQHTPRILGKPKNDAQALSMLRQLAGREHTVCTACCIVWPGPGGGRIESFHDSAQVSFAPWPQDVLAAYVRTGEGRDKAGSYAIQGCGAFLVERIIGQWSTIVGLPVQALVARLLQGQAIAPREQGHGIEETGHLPPLACCGTIG